MFTATAKVVTAKAATKETKATSPDLAETIDAEARRRTLENK